MAGFIPVNDDHAVESVAFQFLFAQPFSAQSLSLFTSSHHKWKDELPAVDQPANNLLSFGGLNWNAASAVSAGFSHIRPDGTPGWQMRIDQNSLTILCTRYTRWDKVWGKALSLLQRAYASISGGTEPAPALNVVILTVTDTFTTIEEGYDVGRLLKDSKFVCDHIRSCGARWHNNSGWFEELDGTPLLHNLGMNSAVLNAEPGNAAGVRAQIGHQQELRLDSPKDFVDIDFSPGGWVDSCMTQLHLSNKIIVKDLLTEELANRIGLDGVTSRG